MIKLRLSRQQIKIIAISFLAAIVWLVAVKMILYQSDSVHYHANFAVYIDGERQQFDSFAYYEEVTQCSVDGSDPSRRVHMHDYVNDVIHIHDEEVTWGHFFANLGWTLGDNLLVTREQPFVEDVEILLNGQSVNQISNLIINSEDQLLVSVGDNGDVDELVATVSSSAAEYNLQPDPSSCSGSSENDGLLTRFKAAIGL